MNGQLKNKENQNIFGYNNSENISHKNMKLSDYLELLEYKIKNIWYNNLSYKLYGWWADHRIVSANTYEIFNVSGGSFNGRRNTENNPFTLNNDGSIELKNIEQDLVFTKINFVSQCNSSTAGNKYIRIRVVRNGNALAEQYSSVYNNGGNNSASCHVCEIGVYLQNGDKIYFECYGAVNDNFSKNSYNVECQYKFYDLENML